MEAIYISCAVIIPLVIVFAVVIRDKQQKINKLQEDIAIIETKYEFINNANQQLKNELELIKQEQQDLLEKKHQLETQNELAKQKLQHQEERIHDFEEAKALSLKAAKEAMFETGSAIFNKTAENTIEKTQKELNKIIESVASLSDRVNKSESTVEKVWRSLATPQAAGNFSEIGLENTLKNFGLEAGRDFIMQYSTGAGQGNLRPDSILFLPESDLMVIDSKASKFFLELADAKDENEYEHKLIELKKSMNEHLKALISKGYKDAVYDSLKTANVNFKIGHIFTVMFIHSEAHVELLLEADPDFRNKAAKNDLVIAGPTGLAGLLSISKFAIAKTKQNQNYDNIIKELSLLLGSIEVVVGHAHKIGKSIESASANFKKFGASVNNNLLAKARRINKLGVALPKNKQIPANLASDAVELVE